ncbi:MAG: DMT family transporter [Sulfitobacter sp.]|nr:DMT family transporter [Sulfitobacter sp.]
MTPDRPLIGILLMLAFCLLAPLADALAKLIGTRIPLAEVVTVRFGLQALLLWPLVWAGRRAWRLSGALLWLVLFRTLLHILGIGMMFAALRFLPLADAVAIVFVLPFLMLLLGRYVLREVVGPRGLSACAMGFLGTLLVIQPSFAVMGWPALLPLAVAVNFAFFMLVTRRIAKVTDPIGLQMVSGFLATGLMLPLLLLQGEGTMMLVSVTMGGTLPFLLLGLGLVGTVAHLLMGWSLRFAPASTLAPMQYLELPFAVLMGFIFFNEVPDRLAVVGILITIAAGLYIIREERANARLPHLKAGQPPPA